MKATDTGIVTTHGTPVSITGYCGKVQPKWAGVPLMLVRVTFHDTDGTDSVGYVYATNLRADGGMNAIDAAVDAAPEVKLTGKKLAEARQRESRRTSGGGLTPL